MIPSKNKNKFTENVSEMTMEIMTSIVSYFQSQTYTIHNKSV